MCKLLIWKNSWQLEIMERVRWKAFLLGKINSCRSLDPKSCSYLLRGYVMKGTNHKTLWTTLCWAFNQEKQKEVEDCVNNSQSDWVSLLIWRGKLKEKRKTASLSKKYWLYHKTKRTYSDLTKKYFQQAKAITWRQCQEAQRIFVKEMITILQTTKKHWSYIKRKRREKTGIFSLIGNNGTLQQIPKSE